MSISPSSSIPIPTNSAPSTASGSLAAGSSATQTSEDSTPTNLAPPSSLQFTTVTSTVESTLTNDSGIPTSTLVGTTIYTTLASAVPIGQTADASTLLSGPRISASSLSPTSAIQTSSISGSSSFVGISKGSSNLSSKAAAGLGIGAAAAGAIVALIVAFTIFHCRDRQRRRRMGYESQIALATSQADFHPVYAPLPPQGISIEKSETAVQEPEIGTANLSEDQVIFSSWSLIQDRIKKHVQGFYHSNETQLSDVSMESFERLGYTRIQPSGLELLDRLRKPKYRVDVLMYLVSWCIVQRIDFRGSRSNTLLPRECIENMKAMSESASSASVTNWRTLTGHLLHKTYVDNGFTRDDARTANLEAALKALMPIFKPFVMEEKVTACFEDLEDILEAAARFGFTLFSSPSLYEFDWHESRWYETGELTPLPELKRASASTTWRTTAAF